MRDALRFIPRQVRARPLACFSVAFLLGLTLRQRYAVPTVLCAAVTVLLAAIWFALRRYRRLIAALLLLTGFLLGMTRMGLALDSQRPVEPRRAAAMVGRVASEPFTNQETGRRVFRFNLESIDSEPCGQCIRMYLRDDGSDDSALALDDIACGQRLRLTGNIYAAGPVTNPYEFDFGAYLARQGMDGYAAARMRDVEIICSSRDIRTAIIDVRHAVAARIDALFPQSAAMMRALVLGDRSLLSDEQRASMKRSGTAHLVSISGLHVTILSALLAFALSRFMSRRAACLVTVGLLLPYGALIGFTAPFVRALAMFAILSFAPIAGLPSDSVTRLCAVMLVWLLIKPLSFGDAGFALSFSASAGILLLMPPLMRLTGAEALSRQKPSPELRKRIPRRAAVYILSVFCASLAAQLGTLPAVISFFGVQSVVSVPFNLICVPLCMAGYILGMLALVISAVCMPVAAAFARLPDALFGWLTAITRFSDGIPLASVRIGRYSFALVVLHWMVTVAASDLSRLRLGLRRWLPLGLVGVAALSSLLVFLNARNTAFVFLDAGQADAAVFRTRGHTYLIDAGDAYTPAADYLNGTCLHLDGVILSHPHDDHAGGLSDVLNSFRPDAIYLPKGWFEIEGVSPDVTEIIDRAREMGVDIVELAAGDSVNLPGGARLDIYAPYGNALPKEINDLSLLAAIRCDGRRVLFTGDLSAEAEPLLIPDADVVKIAHHGSEHATSQRFLAATTPDIAVISVGQNDYGHPRPATLEKLTEAGTHVLRTDQCGAITLTPHSDGWHIDTFLEGPNEVD